MRTSIVIVVISIFAGHADRAAAASSRDIASAHALTGFLAQAAACGAPIEPLVGAYWTWIDKTFPPAERIEALPQFMQSAQRGLQRQAIDRRSCDRLLNAQRLGAMNAMLQQSETSTESSPPLPANAASAVRSQPPPPATPSAGRALQPAHSAVAIRSAPKGRNVQVRSAWSNRMPTANR